MKNNRSLEDRHMNALDHALGRPDDPTAETSRNFFGVEVGSDAAEKMKAHPHWVHTRDFAGTSGFAVSAAGRAALAEYLTENWTPPKRYHVTWDGLTETVEADTAGAAKYRMWRRYEFWDLPFGEFVRDCRARVVRPPVNKLQASHVSH